MFHRFVLLAALVSALLILTLACGPASGGSGSGTATSGPSAMEASSNTASSNTTQASSSTADGSSKAAGASPSPNTTQTSSGSSGGTPTSAQAHSTPETAKGQVNVQTLDCHGFDLIEKIRAEYAANSLRARETYVGEKVCIRGKIESFYETKAHNRLSQSGVVVTVGAGAVFSLRHVDWERWSRANWTGDETLYTREIWKEWVLSKSVGDAVAAKCGIHALTDKKSAYPGTPLFTSCLRVDADGALWAVPTPTPIPTPTAIPCIAVGIGEASSTWMNIDCPNGEVVIGTPISNMETGEYQSLVSGDSTVIAFYFQSIDEPEGFYEHHAPWKRWFEPLEEGDYGSVRFIWQAPPEIAAIIISAWQNRTADGISMLFGDCCYYDWYFELRPPYIPPRDWRPVATTAMPTPAPTPTRRPTLRPQAPLSSAPLTAEFIGIPESHDGEETRLSLLFSQPVQVGEAAMQHAVRVQNGKVKSAGKVSIGRPGDRRERDDLWRVIVQPEGNKDMVITLTAPANCQNPAAICTELDHALSNSPLVTIPYRP